MSEITIAVLCICAVVFGVDAVVMLIAMTGYGASFAEGMAAVTVANIALTIFFCGVTVYYTVKTIRLLSRKD